MGLVVSRAKAEEAGHDVGDDSKNVFSEKNQQAEVESFRKHQGNVARLSFARESRTLVDLGTFGVISTTSARGPSKGYPNGSVVGYAALEDTGLPVFAFSTLSSHTHDIDADPKFSLTVQAPGFRGASDARTTVTGRARKVTDEGRLKVLKERYRQKHPNAFWVEFGDFAMYETMDLVQVRLVGGFARAGSIKPEEFAQAEVDSIVQYSEPICGHMNDDHADQIPAYVQHYTGMRVDEAKMLSVDSLGMNIEAKRDGQSFKVRLPYPQPAEDRKGVKDQIVAMSRAAAASSNQD